MNENTKENRFLVKANGIPSHLVCGYELTKTRLTLRTYVEQNTKIMDRVNDARTASNIEIQHFDDQGNVVDNIVVKTPILLDWSVDASWSGDKPLELKLTYGFNKLD